MRWPGGVTVAAIGMLTVALLGQGAAAPRIEARHATFSIFYERGYEADRDFAATWMDRADTLMRSKYAVTNTGYHVSLYLYSTPNSHADVGHAQIERNGTDRVASIHYLAPSAPPWRVTTKTTSLGLL